LLESNILIHQVVLLKVCARKYTVPSRPLEVYGRFSKLVGWIKF